MTPNTFIITKKKCGCQYIFSKNYGYYAQNLRIIQFNLVKFIQKYILICVYFRGTIKSKKGKGDTDVQVKLKSSKPTDPKPYEHSPEIFIRK